jgi:LAGLIDADG endonuclease
MVGMTGDNAIGADNQQERLGFEQWIVGFVDGEGCFSVPIFRNGSTRLGWQVQPEFLVVQGARSVHVLHELEHYFGCGRVSINRRHDDHREDMYRWAVRSVVDLDRSIVPFFEQYPLRTAKAEEFKRFSAVVRMMRAGDHLSVAGMARIASIAETVNFRRRSRFLESSEAIRQPPRTDSRGEDMVLASRRREDA